MGNSNSLKRRNNVDKHLDSKDLLKRKKSAEKRGIPKLYDLSVAINQRLIDLGKNQEWLVDETRIGKATISAYYNAESLPNGINLLKLAETLQTTPDYLLGYTNTPTTDITIKAMCEKTGLSDKVIDKITDFQDHTIVGLNTLLKSQYAANILSAIYSASEIKDYSGEDLFKFNGIRTRYIQKACEEALLQENLGNVASSVDILAELEYSPKQQAEYMAQRYLTLLLDEISKK